MIARLWTARARARGPRSTPTTCATLFCPTLRETPGYQGATLLERADGGEVEIVVITWWRSVDDIRAFAGDDIERAVVAEEARALLRTSTTVPALRCRAGGSP